MLLESETKTYGDPDYSVPTLAFPCNTPINYIYAPIITINSAGIVHILQAGTTTVFAYTGGDANCNASERLQTLTINKIDQAISAFNPPTSATYGDSPITLSATGGASGNPVTFSVISGSGRITGNILTITGAGTINLKASQAGSTNYSAAPDVNASITVAPIALTITAGDASRAYGEPNPVVTAFTTSGLVGTDSISSVTNTIAASATPTAVPGSTHAITPSAPIFGTGSAGGYTITYVSGTLSIQNDSIAPTVAVTAPSNEANLGFLFDLTGTASDNTGSTGINRVEVQVSVVTGPAATYYINSLGQQTSTPTWVTASGTTSWVFNTSLVNWLANKPYTLKARAIDGREHLSTRGVMVLNRYSPRIFTHGQHQRCRDGQQQHRGELLLRC